jgi:hypothetical protein
MVTRKSLSVTFYYVACLCKTCVAAKLGLFFKIKMIFSYGCSGEDYSTCYGIIVCVHYGLWDVMSHGILAVHKTIIFEKVHSLKNSKLRKLDFTFSHQYICDLHSSAI